MSEQRDPISEQIWELADAQCSGIITEAEMETLEGLLLEHPEYREDYLEYVFLHIGLASAVTSGELATPTEMEASMRERHANHAAKQKTSRISVTQMLCMAVCILSVGLFLLYRAASLSKPAQPPVAEEPSSKYYFDENAIPPAEVATLSEEAQATWELIGKSPALTHEFQPGTVKVTSGNVDVAFSGGADVSVASPALFGMERKNQGTLFSGTLSTKRTERETPFTLETPSVEVVDRGTEYEVSVNEAAETYVHVLEGQVEVKPRGRLPRFFWTFDQQDNEPLIDAIGNSAIKVGKNAQRVPGLVGSGAVHFNNRPDSSLLLGNGGGKEVGTGDYSVATGITVEALVISEWKTPNAPQKKAPFDYDEIFRKEDGSYRILLSFQNDDAAGMTQIPLVERGPCLSFGLFLSGMGYNELDMPLDGKEGRPTLEEIRDGKPHHIVATYNGWTGVKAIYIDGKLRMSHRFPVGTMIISGGSKPAVIGNLISERFETLVGREPFSGVIDEVAFYDYALDPATVAAHYANVLAGKDYFDGQLSRFVLQEQQNGNVLLNKGEKMKFAAETGEPML